MAAAAAAAAAAADDAEADEVDEEVLVRCSLSWTADCNAVDDTMVEFVQGWSLGWWP